MDMISEEWKRKLLGQSRLIEDTSNPSELKWLIKYLRDCKTYAKNLSAADNVDKKTAERIIDLIESAIGLATEDLIKD